MAMKNNSRLNLGRSFGISALALAAAALTVPSMAFAQEAGNHDGHGEGHGGQVHQNRGERPRMMPQGQPQQPQGPQQRPQPPQPGPAGSRDNAWAQSRQNAQARINAEQARQGEAPRPGNPDGRGRDWAGDRARWQNGEQRPGYRNDDNRARGQVYGRVDANRNGRPDRDGRPDGQSGWQAGGRADWQNDRRGNDGRDGRNGWQGDRRGSNDRDNWRGGGNESWRNNRGGDNRSWDRGWRSNNRYDWSAYRSHNRAIFSSGRYYAPYQNYSYRRLNIGFSLGAQFYGSRYWINDPSYYRLPDVYGPYRWVRYYDDVLLVNTYTGEVVDAIYDFYY